MERLPIAPALLILIFACGCGRAPAYQSMSVDELRHWLQAADPAQRAQGAMGLGRHGAGAAEAVDDLVAVLGDADLRVRLEAAVALGAITVPMSRPSSTAPDAWAAKLRCLSSSAARTPG